MLAFTELDGLTTVPGYKAVLKMVVKSQMQLLVEHLSRYTGEESVVLTASTTDGSLSQLGSRCGTGFMMAHTDIHSQFLNFCLQNEAVESRVSDDARAAPWAPSPTSHSRTPSQHRLRGKRSAQQGAFPTPAAKAKRKHTDFNTNNRSVNVHDTMDESLYRQSNAETFRESENMNFYTSDSGSNEPASSSATINNNQSDLDINVFGNQDRSGNETRSQTELGNKDIGTAVEERAAINEIGDQEQRVIDTSIQPAAEGSNDDSQQHQEGDDKDADFPSPHGESIYTGSIKTEQNEEGDCMYLTIKPENTLTCEDTDTSTLEQNSDRKDYSLDRSTHNFNQFGGGVAYGGTMSDNSPQIGSDPLSLLTNISVSCSPSKSHGFLIPPNYAVKPEANPEDSAYINDQTSPISRNNIRVGCAPSTSRGFLTTPSYAAKPEELAYMHDHTSGQQSPVQKTVHRCTFCDKEFSERQNLRVHIRMHTGEKPYSCAICSKAFAHSSNLRQHERGVHKVFRPTAPWSYSALPSHSQSKGE